MSYQNGPRIVTNGLVLCLDAGNSKSYPGSGTSWTDLSGNGNNGTLTNGPTYSSANKGSIVFDGVNDYITIQNSSSINIVNISVSLWLKASSLSTDKVLLSKGTGGNRTYWFYENNGISFAYASFFTGYIGANQITNEKWHNIIGIYNGTTLSIYLDAILISSVAASVSATTTDILGINAYPNGSYFSSTKNISLIQIYNRALSVSEILNNYNALKGRFGL